MFTRLLPLALFCFAVLGSVSLAGEITVPNVGAVEGAIKHSEGRELYSRHMDGQLPQKGFGRLPDGLDETALARWLAPEENTAFLTMTGAMPWGPEGQYIASLCFAHDAEDFSSTEGKREELCGYDFNLRHARKLYLGVFQWKDNTLTPVASAQGPINTGVSWKNTNLAGPEDDGEPVLPHGYTRLDLAPYAIAPGVMAFGVRGEFSIGYAGGGAFYDALQLFMVKGDHLVNIFSEPTYFLTDFAGNWHEDGTRDHDVNEGKNIVRVLRSQTAGYYDLQIASVGKKMAKSLCLVPLA